MASRWLSPTPDAPDGALASTAQPPSTPHRALGRLLSPSPVDVDNADDNHAKSQSPKSHQQPRDNNTTSRPAQEQRTQGYFKHSFPPNSVPNPLLGELAQQVADHVNREYASNPGQIETNLPTPRRRVGRPRKGTKGPPRTFKPVQARNYRLIGSRSEAPPSHIFQDGCLRNVRPDGSLSPIPPSQPSQSRFSPSRTVEAQPQQSNSTPSTFRWAQPNPIYYERPKQPPSRQLQSFQRPSGNIVHSQIAPGGFNPSAPSRNYLLNKSQPDHHNFVATLTAGGANSGPSSFGVGLQSIETGLQFRPSLSLDNSPAGDLVSAPWKVASYPKSARELIAHIQRLSQGGVRTYKSPYHHINHSGSRSDNQEALRNTQGSQSNPSYSALYLSGPVYSSLSSYHPDVSVTLQSQPDSVHNPVKHSGPPSFNQEDIQSPQQSLPASVSDQSDYSGFSSHSQEATQTVRQPQPNSYWNMSQPDGLPLTNPLHARPLPAPDSVQNQQPRPSMTQQEYIRRRDAAYSRGYPQQPMNSLRQPPTFHSMLQENPRPRSVFDNTSSPPRQSMPNAASSIPTADGRNMVWESGRGYIPESSPASKRTNQASRNVSHRTAPGHSALSPSNRDRQLSTSETAPHHTSSSQNAQSSSSRIDQFQSSWNMPQRATSSQATSSAGGYYSQTAASDIKPQRVVSSQAGSLFNRPNSDLLASETKSPSIASSPTLSSSKSYNDQLPASVVKPSTRPAHSSSKMSVVINSTPIRPSFEASNSPQTTVAPGHRRPRSRPSGSTIVAPRVEIPSYIPSGNSIPSFPSLESTSKKRGRPFATPEAAAAKAAAAAAIRSQPKKRGRPFATPQAAAKAAAKKANREARLNGEIVPRKRGRPFAPPSVHVDVPVPEPKFNIFYCEWVGCPAELHNAETLRKHLHAVHCKFDSKTKKIPCLWKNCSDDSDDISDELGQLTRRQFTSKDEWKAHVEEAHMLPVLWHQGDGPKATDLSRPVQKTTREKYPWLFDKNGIQVTPLVDNLETYHGSAKEYNEKRFKKRRDRNGEIVYELIDVPESYKKVRKFEDDDGDVEMN